MTNDSNTNATVSPPRIRLSGIDRVFLTPEPKTGRYFPRSTLTDLGLRQPIPREQFVDALCRLTAEQPALRLAYRLDVAHGCWTRLPESEWRADWERCVHSGPMPALNTMLADNNDPISDPVHVYLNDDRMRIRINHVFGDATAMKVALAYLVNALFETDHPLPSLGTEMGLNVAQFIGRSEFGWPEVLRAMWGMVRTSQPTATSQPRQPVQIMYSRVPLAVERFTYPENIATALKQLRRELKVNFTILLQALIGYRMRQLGLLSGAHPYTVPIDLRQFLPAGYYPGNLLSFIQLVADGQTFHEEAQNLQTAFDLAEKQRLAVAPLPLSCMVMSLGGRVVDRLNVDYLQKQPARDPRLFILSNFGNVLFRGKNSDAYIDWQSGAGVAIPLMDGPGLMLSFYIVEGHPNLTVTYDPLRWTSDQVSAIAAIFNDLPSSTTEARLPGVKTLG